MFTFFRDRQDGISRRSFLDGMETTFTFTCHTLHPTYPSSSLEHKKLYQTATACDDDQSSPAYLFHMRKHKGVQLVASRKLGDATCARALRVQSIHQSRK